MAPTGLEPPPLLAIWPNIGAIAPEINPCVAKGKGAIRCARQSPNIMAGLGPSPDPRPDPHSASADNPLNHIDARHRRSSCARGFLSLTPVVGSSRGKAPRGPWAG